MPFHQDHPESRAQFQALGMATPRRMQFLLGQWDSKQAFFSNALRQSIQYLSSFTFSSFPSLASCHWHIHSITLVLHSILHGQTFSFLSLHSKRRPME